MASLKTFCITSFLVFVAFTSRAKYFAYPVKFDSLIASLEEQRENKIITRAAFDSTLLLYLSRSDEQVAIKAVKEIADSQIKLDELAIVKKKNESIFLYVAFIPFLSIAFWIGHMMGKRKRK